MCVCVCVWGGGGGGASQIESLCTVLRSVGPLAVHSPSFL